MKVSVLVPTHRPGYMDTLAAAFAAQTLPQQDWEVVLVDELYDLRKDLLPPLMPRNFKHIRQEPSLKTQCTAAQNLGLKQCEGELVYFMCDYNYPHPRCLERHWEIYQRHGPKVFISGPVVDALTFSGKSILEGAQPVMLALKLASEGRTVIYPELVPPISLEVKDNYDIPSPDNLLSIFKILFTPVWRRFPPDWRMAEVCNVSVAKDLYECLVGPKWWWTRNDSAPRADLGDGMPESETRSIGADGCDTLMISKLVAKGYRYLVDREAPSYILPHPWRKTLV